MKFVGASVAASAAVVAAFFVLQKTGGSFVLRAGDSSLAASVLFEGCDRIANGTCFLDFSPNGAGKTRERIRVWTPATPASVEVRLNGREIAATTATAAGGLGIDFECDAPGRIAVTFADDSDARTRTWGLSLRQDDASVPFPGSPAARDNEPNAAAIDQWVREGSPVQAVAGYLWLARGARDNGDPLAVLKYRRSAVAVAHEAGEWSLEANARFALSYSLGFTLFRLDDAERELRAAEALADRVPSVRAYAPYYRALIGLATGDIGSTLADLRQAARYSEALGLERQWHLVDEQRASADLELGYFEAALGRYRRMLRWAADQDRRCEEALAATNIAWTQILMRQRQPRLRADFDVEAMLRRALAIYESKTCRDPGGRPSIVMLNLAVAALQNGRAQRAEEWLQRIRSGPESRRYGPWITETRARIAIAKGNLLKAKALSDEMIANARAVAGTDNLYRAYVLSADVLTRLGSAEALQARQRAELTLDRLAVGVPLVGARHAFLTVRDENVLGLADLQVVHGQPGAALDAVRRARSRSLGWARVSQGLARLSADARARWNALLGEYGRIRTALDREIESDWTFAASELDAARQRRAAQEARLVELIDEALSLLPATPKDLAAEPGVLRLAWVRLRSGVFIIGQLGEDTFSIPWRIDSRSVPEAVARRLARADRVLLHPYGDLRKRDLHMLRWRGRPMAAQILTGFSLDLSTVRDAALPSSALVVVDPAAELARGREEAALVTRSLRAAGAEVVSVRGDVASVRAALGETEWFHFGGHGRWSPDDPMAGGLALADGARLGLGDILAASQVPETVVLTSCEAGRSAARGGEAFGIAHAFLVAGARVVVAPDREVRDDEAFRFADAFYAASGTALERYRTAVDRLGDGASAFRVFVP